MLLAREAMLAPYTNEHRELDQRLRATLAANYPMLRRALRRLGVPAFELDDVAQETFLTFYRKAEAVHPKAERQFILQVAFRIVRRRERGRMRRREDLEPAFEQLAEMRPSPEEEMSRQEAIAVLDAVLQAMPVELRMVLNLCDIEQLSTPEAAAILEIPLGTATSRLRRARELFEKLALRARSSNQKGILR
jgi:RNA polymerase sigma-70 factor, ECF subfamily